MKVSNNVFIEIRDAKTKEVIGTRESHNLMTTLGLNWVRDLMGGTEVRASVIRVGVGTAAPSASDDALASEVLPYFLIDRRIAGTAKMTHKVFIPTGSANGNTLSEMGLFRGSLLIARALISPAIVKTDAVELTIAHEITVT